MSGKTKEKLLISACLLGVPCRYDGRAVTAITPSDLAALSERYELIPVCPEIYGGLPTPRVPSERIGGRVMNREGGDVTENYARGAASTRKIAQALGAKIALLKERSPSCGVGKIYDGSFSGRLIPGDGVTAEALREDGVALFGESELSELIGGDRSPRG